MTGPIAGGADGSVGEGRGCGDWAQGGIEVMENEWMNPSLSLTPLLTAPNKQHASSEDGT